MFDTHSLLHSSLKLSVSSSLCHLSFPFSHSFAVSGNRQDSMSRAPGWTRRSIAVQHHRQRPHPSGVSVVESILDQYSQDKLTSAFNSMRPNLRFVSWLLIKWMPPGPDLQWKDYRLKHLQLPYYLLIPHSVISVSPSVKFPPELHRQEDSSCISNDLLVLGEYLGTDQAHWGRCFLLHVWVIKSDWPVFLVDFS